MIRDARKFKSFRSFERRYHIKHWKYLGRGTYGRAYDIGRGLVCKITQSRTEVSAAIKIMNSTKTTSFLYKVLDVIPLYSRGMFCYGLIITPKYQKLTRKQENKLRLLHHIDFISAPRTKDKLRKLVKSELRKGYHSPEVINQTLKSLDDFDIPQMLNNLRALRIKPIDLHYENIMRNGSRYILIDPTP